MKRFLSLVFVAVLLIPMVVGGQTTVVNVTWTWTAPTTGSVVHHYVVQSSSNGTTWTTEAPQPTITSYTKPCPVGVVVMIRVAGVDAQGRQGVWSDPADPFTPDAGVPGVPGKPVKS